MKIKTLTISVIFCLSIFSCETTPSLGILQSCEGMTDEFQKLIETEFNYCELDKDCNVVSGICPLGCFFIVHEENISQVEEMKKKTKLKCGECYYKCIPEPKKLRCINKICYPDIEDKIVYYLFNGDCDKIVEIYSEVIIGKKYNELDLHLLDFEIVKRDSIVKFKRAAQGLNNIKLFVNAKGIIESVSCLERKNYR